MEKLITVIHGCSCKTIGQISPIETLIKCLQKTKFWVTKFCCCRTLVKIRNNGVVCLLLLVLEKVGKENNELRHLSCQQKDRLIDLKVSVTLIFC